MGQQRQQLTALTAVGEQHNNVIGSHNPQIPMQGIEGIEIEGHQANRGECGRDLAGHDPAFTHTCDDQLGALLAAVLQQIQGGLGLIGPQLSGRVQQRLGFLLQHRGQRIHRRPSKEDLKLRRFSDYSL